MINTPAKISAFLLGLFLLGCPQPKAQADSAEDARAATKQAAADVLQPLVAEILSDMETQRLVAELAGGPEKRVLVAIASPETSEELR